MQKLPRLERLLEYQHEDVIKRYMKDYKQSKSYAKRIFTELLKFLWLAQKARVEKARVTMAIHEEMLEIDLMWHTFILFTKDYEKFGKKYFGHYMHHEPNVTPVSKQSKKKARKELEKFLSYAYDNLGEKTLKYWFRSIL